MTRSPSPRPVLTESARLSTEDLVEIAETKGEPHLLAISGRWWLKEVVTDAHWPARYPSVSRRIISNPGARLSAAGFAIVVAQAEADPELAVETGIRVDLPPELRHQLLRSATEAVRVAAAVPRAAAPIRGNPQCDCGASRPGVNREMSRARDFAAAKRMVARLKDKGELNEATLFEFAKQRKYEETVAALAELSQSTIEVVRPLMQSLRDDGVLVPCKAAGLSWDTVHAVLESRFATGSMGPREFASRQKPVWQDHSRKCPSLAQLLAGEIVADLVQRELSRDGDKRGSRFSFLLMLRRKWQALSISASLSRSFNAGLLLRNRYVICQNNIERVG